MEITLTNCMETLLANGVDIARAGSLKLSDKLSATLPFYDWSYDFPSDTLSISISDEYHTKPLPDLSAFGTLVTP